MDVASIHLSRSSRRNGRCSRVSFDARESLGVFDTFRQFNHDAPTSPRTRLFTKAYVHADLPPHRTDQYLLPLQGLNLPIPTDKRMAHGFTSADETAVEAFLTHNGVGPSERIFIIAPMTTWPSRCWDADRYAALGDALAKKHGGRVILIGSASERAAVEGVAARCTATPILTAGLLRFREMAALIARASLLVSGDTGPMHAAAAVGTPYVALFGPTPVAGRAPIAGKGITLMHPVHCGPCDQKICPNGPEDFMRCMRLLTVNEALAAANQLLHEASAAS